MAAPGAVFGVGIAEQVELGPKGGDAWLVYKNGQDQSTRDYFDFLQRQAREAGTELTVALAEECLRLWGLNRELTSAAEYSRQAAVSQAARVRELRAELAEIGPEAGSAAAGCE